MAEEGNPIHENVISYNDPQENGRNNTSSLYSWIDDCDSQDDIVKCVKARIRKEGREARNLIAYNILLDDDRAPSRSKIHHGKLNKIGTHLKESKKTLPVDKRPRSVSVGRVPHSNLRARHWGFLFRNLGQAVDEIYKTCEDDERVVECKEAIMMLEKYAHDFYKLIDWLVLKWEYDNTKPLERPNSLTWDIRTFSPGKVTRPNRSSSAASEARKQLNLNSVPNPSIVISNSSDNKVNPKATNVNSTTATLNEKRENKSSQMLNSRIPEEPLTASDNDAKTEATTLKSKDVVNTTTKVHNKFPPLPTKDTGTKPKGSTKESESTQNCGNVKVCKDSSNNAPVKPSSSSEASKNTTGKPETKKSVWTDTQHSKNIYVKPGPMVNMNKASQVRKAFNQSRTPQPQKAPCSNVWKSQHEAKKSDSKIQCLQPGNVVILQRNTQMKNGLIRSATTLEGSHLNQAKRNSRKTSERCLEYEKCNSNSSLSSTATSSGNQSWADKVKGKTKSDKCDSVSSLSLFGTDDEEDGWEVVKRRGNRGGSSASLNSKNLAKKTSTLKAVKFYNPKTRFEAPSSALSLPSLSSITSEEPRALIRILKTSKKPKEKKSTSPNSNNPYSNMLSPDEISPEHTTNCRSNKSNANILSTYLSTGNLNSRPNSTSCFGETNSKKEEKFSFDSSKIKISEKSRKDLTNLSKKKEGKLRSNESLNSSDSKLFLSTISKDAKISSKAKFKHQDNVNKLKASKSKSLEISSSNLKSERSADKINEKNRKLSMNKKGNSLNSSNPEMSGKKTDITEEIFDFMETHSNPLITPRSKSMSEIDMKKDNVILDSQDDADLPLETSTDQTEVKNLKNTEMNNSRPPCEIEPTIVEEQIIDDKLSISEEQIIEACEDDGRESPLTEEYTSPSSGKEEISCEKDSGDESEKEEEKLLRSNAEALATAEFEEKRLEEEIAETENDSIEVEDIEEDELEDKEPKDEFYDYSPSAFPSSSSWAEEIDAAESRNAIRPPGMVLQIHEKLSSPSRKLPILEKFRRHKERLAKAQELRGKLLLAKTEKLKDLFKKIDEVNIDKERLLIEKRDLFDRKMERAEEKRRVHLQEIVNKAHDEETKAKEIAFINGLEAQNKLHDILQHQQTTLLCHESRLADRAEERNRKQEEKAAKEVAAQDRRKALEAERQARMAELCEKRRQRCERIDRQQVERREELLEQAEKKARDREERLTALQQAQLAKESELVKKIQQKQEETARRHEENIEHIRQKALESSIMNFSRGCDDAPKIIKYEMKKFCTLCNALIASEVYLMSHLRGKQHKEALDKLNERDVTLEESQVFNIQFIVDAPSNVEDPEILRDFERKKSLKKRTKKIRSRMVTKAESYLQNYKSPPKKSSPNFTKMKKTLDKIDKLIGSQGTGPWSATDSSLLDRHLLSLIRDLQHTVEGNVIPHPAEQASFLSLKGIKRITTLLELSLSQETTESFILPSKCIKNCGKVIFSAANLNLDADKYILYSNLIMNYIDCVMKIFPLMQKETDDSSVSKDNVSFESILPSMMDVVCVTFMGNICNIQNLEKENEDFKTVMLDVVSYCVSVGLTDQISLFFNRVQKPLDNGTPSFDCILLSMTFLYCLAAVARMPRTKSSDPTFLLETFKVRDACGVISLLYGLLLHQGGRTTQPPSEDLLSPMTLMITSKAIDFLTQLAMLDVKLFQSVLGSEGISLEFRHICSFLLWYGTHWPSCQLLRPIISLVGYFAINNKENQLTIQSGETPSVLQQLLGLPWQHFSDPQHSNVLFPTLLACCYDNCPNIAVLKQEMSFTTLEDFIASGESPTPLMKLFRESLETEK